MYIVSNAKEKNYWNLVHVMLRKSILKIFGVLLDGFR